MNYRIHAQYSKCDEMTIVFFDSHHFCVGEF